MNKEIMRNNIEDFVEWLFLAGIGSLLIATAGFIIIACFKVWSL